MEGRLQVFWASFWSRMRQALFDTRVLSRKRFIEQAGARFLGLPEVGFVFQTHNKGSLFRQTLKPILDALGPQNVIVFADACVDGSAERAQIFLPGKNHFIVSSNNTFEIVNYRLAATILKSLGCRYMVLLQDDDFYSSRSMSWFAQSLRIMEEDSKVSIIGGHQGSNIGRAGFMREADEGLMTASWSIECAESEEGVRYEELGNYYRFQEVTVSSCGNDQGWEYCAFVNRAPQMVRISDVEEFGYFPRELEPYQYDDYFNCLKAWSNGRKVILAPIIGRSANLGIGGMRLYNLVSENHRPQHFISNHNYVHGIFGNAINSGDVQALVDEAKRGKSNGRRNSE